MKRILISLFVLGLTTVVFAQSSLISFGLRGGGVIYLTNDNMDSRFGGQGIFDFGYTYYWSLPSECEVGIRTGLNFGYSGLSASGEHHDTFVNTDYLGYKMQYQTSANYQQRIHQLQLEIPLMFALRTDGIFVNVGAKFMMPVWSQCNQTLSNASINAYYEVTDVWVKNQAITGVVNLDDKYSYKDCVPLFNILASVEIGHEWNFDRYRVGLGIYLDIAPWSYSKQTEELPLIEVSPISNPTNPPAQVSTHPIPIIGNTNYLDVGLKIYYGFNLMKK